LFRVAESAREILQPYIDSLEVQSEALRGLKPWWIVAVSWTPGPSLEREVSVMSFHRGTRRAMAALLKLSILFLSVVTGLFAATASLAQSWPPPPQTVPSIGLRTPQALPPATVPTIGLRTPQALPPATVPSIGLSTPQAYSPKTAPSIGSSTPPAYEVPSIGLQTPEAFPPATVGSIGSTTPQPYPPATVPSIGLSR
jgi:hypothetical protein